MAIDFMPDLLADPYIADSLRRRGMLPGMTGVLQDGTVDSGSDQSPYFGSTESETPYQEDPSTGGGRLPSPASTPSAPAPQQGGRGFLSRLGSALPKLASGAIAGGATQNVAHGGATDVFRAMQAGHDEAQNRDIMLAQAQRQRDIDEEQRRYRQMQEAELAGRIERERAQAEHQKAMAARNAQMVEISPDMAKTYGVMPDADGKFRIPAARLSQLKPQKPASNVIRTKWGPVTIDPETGEADMPAEATLDGRLSWALGKYGGKAMNDLPEDVQAWVMRPNAMQVPKPDKAPVLHNVPPGGSLVGPDGKPVFTAPPKPPRPADPVLAELHKTNADNAKAKVFDDIDKRKAAELHQADEFEANEMKRVQQNQPKGGVVAGKLGLSGPAGVDPVKAAADIKAKANQMRQRAFDNYSQGIRRHGGVSEDWQVQPDGSVAPKGEPYGGNGPTTQRTQSNPNGSGPAGRMAAVKPPKVYMGYEYTWDGTQYVRGRKVQ